MSTFLRPNATAANPGSWTGSATSIDETTASDSDVVTSPSNPAGAVVDFGLTDPAPLSSGSHTLRARANKSGGKSATLAAEVVADGATKASIAATGQGTSFATLSAGSASAVTDWAGAVIRLTANSSGGGSPTTVQVSWAEVEAPNAVPPPAPTGLTADPGDGQADLTWDSYSGADRTGTNIYVDGVLEESGPSTWNLRTVSGLTNGTEYELGVSFTGPGGESSITTVLVTPTLQPPSGVAAEAGNGTVNLTWTPSANATGHKVYRDTVLIDTLGVVSEYLDEGLTNGTTYSYEVSSTDAGGESAKSAAIEATPTATERLYPISTISVGGWDWGVGTITTDLHLRIDTHDDDSETIGYDQTGEGVFELLAPTDPIDPAGTAVLRANVVHGSGVGTINTITAKVYKDGVEVLSTQFGTTSGGFAVRSYTLTSTEVEALGDGTGLTLGVIGTNNRPFIDWIDLTVPVDAGGTRNISPSGIATTEAFGTTTVVPGAVDVAPTGIDTAEAFGTATVTVAPPDQTVAPTGIATAEAFGSSTITPGSVTVAPTGVATAEVFGAATLTPGAVELTVTGIAPTEAFGAATVTLGPVTVAPAGVASLEAFGSPTLTVGSVDISPTGIASLEAFGTPVVGVVTPGSIEPVGLPTEEAFGTATVAPGAVTIAPTGIAAPSTETDALAGEPWYDFESDVAGWAASGAGATVTHDSTTAGAGTGSLKLTKGTGLFPNAQTVNATTGDIPVPAGPITVRFWAKASLATECYITLLNDGSTIFQAFDATTDWQQFEVPATFDGTVLTQIETGFNDTLPATGDSYWFDGLEVLTTAEAVGTPTVTPGPVDITSAGIASGEAFGSATVATAPTGNDIAPTGVGTAEAFGAVTVTPGSVDIAPTGIPTGEAFGSLVVAAGQTVAPTGIATSEAFGTPTITSVVAPDGLASEEGFGTPELTTGAVGIVVTGISTEEGFGRRPKVRLTHRRVLRTPSVQENLLDLGGHPQPWSVDQGISLLKIDGVYHQVRWPTDGDIAAATAVYRGGFDHEVDDAEVADLTAAGYGDYIQLVPA